MFHRLPGLVSVAFALFCLPLLAQPPKPKEPAKEPPKEREDEPLPTGAHGRLSVSRFVLRTTPSVALVPPLYKDFLAPTMADGVRRYDLHTGRPLQKQGIVGPGRVIVSGDGRRAAMARNSSIRIVDAVNNDLILAVHPPEGVIISSIAGLSLSADGHVLAYGGRGKDGAGVAVVWDVDRNELLAKVDTIQGTPVHTTLSNDGKFLVTHGPPPPASTLGAAKPTIEVKAKEKIDPEAVRTAQVWDVETGDELFKARCTGMGGMVVSSAISADNEMLAVSAGDGPVDLWSMKTGKRLQTLLGLKRQGVHVAFAPDGRTVASIGPDYRIEMWTVEGKPLGVCEPPPGILTAQVTGLAFADNDRAIAWTTVAQFAVAWEAPGGQLLSPVMDHLAGIRSISFPAGGKDAYTSGHDGHVFRWDLASHSMAERVDLHPTRIPGEPLIRPSVSLSRDGTLAIGMRAPIEIFDMATGYPLFCVPYPSMPTVPVRFTLSGDGKQMMLLGRQPPGRRTGMCVVWNLDTAQRSGEFEIVPSSNAEAPHSVMTPDGRRVAIIAPVRRPTRGGENLLVVGYDLKTGEKTGEVEDDHPGGSVTLTAADDRTIVAASITGRVWTMDFMAGKVGEDIDKLTARGEDAVHGPIVFSPDGKLFAIGIVDEPFTTYGVRVYDWATKKPLHTFVGHRAPVNYLRYTDDGKHLASGSADTSVIIWDIAKIGTKK